MRRIIAALTAFLMLVTAAYSATYYVDGTLAAHCDGTIYHYDVATRSRISGAGQIAWKSMYPANTTMTAGDICYIRGGASSIDTMHIGPNGSDTEGINPSHSGTDANHRITYSVYPGEKVALYGSTWDAIAIHIADKDWITITGYDGTTSAMNLKCIHFDQGFLLLQSDHKNRDGSWDGTGGSNYNEISYCEFAYDQYRNYTEWQPNHDYSVGDVVVPVAKKNYDTYTVISGGGRSGSTEPDWKVDFNNDGTHIFTNDGDVVWDFNPAMAWRGSTIYLNSCYNWIHHCSFHDFGFYGLTYDGGTLFEIGWDDCGLYSDCTDTTNSNVIENCQFYHGGHHTIGIMNYFNVIRNNIIHNEQYFPRGGDGVWHSYRNIEMVGPSASGYQSKHGYNLVEGNRVSHGSENMNTSNGGEGMFLMQNNDIIRYNDMYAGAQYALVTPLHPSTEFKYDHVYNNTIFANGYKATFPDIANRPSEDTHDRRAVQICSGWQGQSWQSYTETVFKNNLFWKNWGYDSGLDMIISNYGPDWNFICGDSVCADMIFDHNFNSTGTEVDPKFISEGSYGNPHVNSTNIEWYWYSPSIPDGSDITTHNTEPDFNLQSLSPAIDGGTYLTQATNSASAASPSPILAVDDVKYFQPGWGNDAGGGASVQADWIAIGTSTNTVQISSIDYSNKTITLSSPMTWSNGAPVWLYKNSKGEVVLSGNAPDYGAHECLSTSAQLFSIENQRRQRVNQSMIRLSIGNGGRNVWRIPPSLHALSIKIFDIQGRVLREIVFPAGAAGYLSLEGAGAGVRILKVSSEEPFQ